ncbi:CopY/TcrY family copper transport repressor [Fundicoccus culcitae]|uniref:CopY/TcrY family copper transport repressor n=1 Tax=Fundicoccus culcitae TaxID=2969821 RepID=A0ABY5P280_9LACT|nr:CopY/TcrY family copper transport repressor [Fundicoccus culcitae]UUX32816.1 CopY/TcrY family copper transport repressor [Fundicoccus culcitae]
MNVKQATVSISDAEWEVMRVVWASNYMTSREIIDTLMAIKDWKEGTIKSLLNRLIQKEAIAKDTSTTPYTYYPTISLVEATQQRSDDLVSQTCTRDRADIIQHLIDTNELSQDDIQNLMDSLQNKLKTAPTSVTCQCPAGQCHCHLH